MRLENQLELLNSNVFFREFSIARNVFLPAQGTEQEFADHVVWIGDELTIYQLKERTIGPGAVPTAESEAKWFKSKIQRRAKDQIKATIGYLDEHSSIVLINQRGDTLDIGGSTPKVIRKIILYSTPKAALLEGRAVKFIISTSAGFIHILTLDEYSDVCNLLYTPAEIGEYLDFRERAVRASPGISETALLGQFVSDASGKRPDESFQTGLKTLVNDIEQFDIRPIMDAFRDKLDRLDPNEPHLYYRVLAELAQLKRSDLRQFKLRYFITADRCCRREERYFTRFYCPRLSAGFVFMTFPERFNEQERIACLQGFTELAKHVGQVDKQMGVSMTPDGPEILIDWCLIEHPWSPDTDLDRILEQGGNPFSPVREAMLPTYLHRSGSGA